MSLITCSGLHNEEKYNADAVLKLERGYGSIAPLFWYLVAGVKIDKTLLRKREYASGMGSAWKQSTFSGKSDLFSLLSWLFGVFFNMFLLQLFTVSLCFKKNLGLTLQQDEQEKTS